MKISFDITALDNPSLTSANVFVVFAAAESDMVYGSGSKKETIHFAGNSIVIGGKGYGTSKAYSLKDIADNGLVLNTATSLVGFICYGDTTNIELLGLGCQPALLSSLTPRYSIFEISYNGSTGGADITNISQYGGSIQLAFLDKKNVQTYIGNTSDTTSTFNALAATSGFSGATSTAAVYLDSDGKFLRVLGTNVFPNGATQNPYPNYNAYLQSLFTTYGDTSVVKELTNLAPQQNPGGTGSVGYTSTSTAKKVTPSTLYNLDYHFTAIVSQVTAPAVPPLESNPNGTYSVTLNGYVNATLPSGNTTKYDDLSISISADDLSAKNVYMSNFIYQAATTGAGISVTNSGWSDVNNDFDTATVNAALLLKAAGDFAQGITCGFPGSGTDSDSLPGTDLSKLSSYEWWQNPLLAYSPAQTANPYYSAYGNVISANSAGTNGITFSRGGVYGSPYDDRFGLNLISPDSNTDEMLVTLLKDGALIPISSSGAC